MAAMFMTFGGTGSQATSQAGLVGSSLERRFWLLVASGGHGGARVTTATVLAALGW